MTIDGPTKTPLAGRISRSQAVDTGMALVLLCLLAGLFRARTGWFAVAAVLLVLNMTVPQIFRPAARIWFGLSRLLGAVVSKVLLGLVFALVVTPIGLLRRRLGKDPMGLRLWKKNEDSVFVVRDKAYGPSDVEQPF